MPPPSPFPPPYIPGCFTSAATCGAFCAAPRQCAFNPAGGACGGANRAVGYNWACVEVGGAFVDPQETPSVLLSGGGAGNGNQMDGAGTFPGADAKAFGCGGGGAALFSANNQSTGGGAGGAGGIGGGGGGAANVGWLSTRAAHAGGAGGSGAVLLRFENGSVAFFNASAVLAVPPPSDNASAATTLTFWAVGAGGGGAGAAYGYDAQSFGFSGGGAGAVAVANLTLPPGTLLSLTVGDGGPGSFPSNATYTGAAGAAGDGGNTSVSRILGSSALDVLLCAGGGKGATMFVGGRGGEVLAGGLGAGGGVGGSTGSANSGADGGGAIGLSDADGGSNSVSSSFGRAGADARDVAGLFTALRDAFVLPPNLTTACFANDGCNGACAAQGMACVRDAAARACAGTALAFSCTSPCFFGDATCGLRCPSGFGCTLDVNCSLNNYNNGFSCAVQQPWSRWTGSSSLSCFNNPSCSGICGPGTACAPSSDCGYNAHACLPAAPPRPASMRACFQAADCGGACTPGQACVYNALECSSTLSRFTCELASLNAALVNGEPCFTTSDCDGSCGAFSASCAMAWSSYASTRCSAWRPYACAQGCENPWDESCGGGYCQEVVNRFVYGSNESSACRLLGSAAGNGTHPCVGGGYACVGGATCFSDSSCGDGCDSRAEVCDRVHPQVQSCSSGYRCKGPADCFTDSACGGLCPPGSVCSSQSNPKSGVCASAYGFMCEVVTPSTCFQNDACNAACPLGSECTPVTAARSAAWGGVCAGSGGVFYTPNSSAPALGFACRACAPGSLSCAQAFDPSGCFQASTFCSACPKGTLCADVRAQAPCSPSQQGYTCVPYEESGQPKCFNATNGNWYGGAASCGTCGASGGASCLSASWQDCITVTGEFAPSVGGLLNLPSFFACVAPQACFPDAACTSACAPPTVCGWISANAPCSSAKRGYSCVAPTSPLCHANASCGGADCGADAGCFADAASAVCSSGVYASPSPPPAPPPPTRFAPPGDSYCWIQPGVRCVTALVPSVQAVMLSICAAEGGACGGDASLQLMLRPSWSVGDGGASFHSTGLSCNPGQCNVSQPLAYYGAMPSPKPTLQVDIMSCWSANATACFGALLWGSPAVNVTTTPPAPVTALLAPPPPGAPQSALSNWRCLSPDGCFSDQSCAGACPTGTYCAMTPRCNGGNAVSAWTWQGGRAPYACVPYAPGDCFADGPSCVAACHGNGTCVWDAFGTCAQLPGRRTSGGSQQLLRCAIGYGACYPSSTACNASACASAGGACLADADSQCGLLAPQGAPTSFAQLAVCKSNASCFPFDSACAGLCAPGHACAYQSSAEVAGPCASGAQFSAVTAWRGAGYACTPEALVCFLDASCSNTGGGGGAGGATLCSSHTACTYVGTGAPCGGNASLPGFRGPGYACLQPSSTCYNTPDCGGMCPVGYVCATDVLHDACPVISSQNGGQGSSNGGTNGGRSLLGAASRRPSGFAPPSPPGGVVGPPLSGNQTPSSGPPFFNGTPFNGGPPFFNGSGPQGNQSAGGGGGGGFSNNSQIGATNVFNSAPTGGNQPMGGPLFSGTGGNQQMGGPPFSGTGGNQPIGGSPFSGGTGGSQPMGGPPMGSQPSGGAASGTLYPPSSTATGGHYQPASPGSWSGPGVDGPSWRLPAYVFSCHGPSSCFAPTEPAACARACFGEPCVPMALAVACGSANASLVDPMTSDTHGLVCLLTGPLQHPQSAGYYLNLVTSIPLAALIVAVWACRIGLLGCCTLRCCLRRALPSAAPQSGARFKDTELTDVASTSVDLVGRRLSMAQHK